MKNKKKLTPTQRLQAADQILSFSDLAFEADLISGGLRKSKTTVEKDFAKMITDLYVIIHPHGKCRHPEWDEFTLSRLEKNT